MFDIVVPHCLTFYWSIERLSNSHHHISPKNPENVVEEESAQQNATNSYSVQLKYLYSINRERQTKYVISNPVLKPEERRQQRYLVAIHFSVVSVTFHNYI